MKLKKAQSGTQLKGKIISTDVVNRQIPVRLKNNEIIMVDAIDERYLNPDSIVEQDSVIVTKHPFENKAKTFKSNKQVDNKIKKKQFGSSNTETILAEDGEIFMDEEGNLQKVNSFSHDDKFIEDELGNVFLSPEGGQIVEAQSVLSDSYSQVKDGDRKNTQKEKVLAFKPKESKKLFDYKWFNTSKTLSPSELVEEVIKQRDKKLNKYAENQQDDSITKNSTQLNISQMPSDDEIYEITLNKQQGEKASSGYDFEENIAKDGIYIKKNNRGKLHDQLNLPQDEKIPLSKLQIHEGDSEQLRKRKQFALNAREWKHQFGGISIPSSLNGVYDYPEQIVEVPENQITMQDVDYPIAAFDNQTGEYLTTMNPEENYYFPESEGIIEVPRTNKYGMKKAQFGEGTYFPPKYRVKQNDTLSKIAEAYGISLDQLLESNPDIVDSNRINVGDELTIPDVTIKADRTNPVDRSAEIADIQELPEELNVQAEDVIPTLDVSPETVAPVSKTVTDAVKKLNDDVSLGRIDRTQGTNALRAMMRANASINLPYRPETPSRLFSYQEEDVTPYLDEIDSQVEQQLQYINTNSTQGQAQLANLMNNANRAKRQTLNKINQANLQRRQQTDNINVQQQNQFDMMQEQANKNYTDEVYQTVANYDRNKVQQADYLDQMINNNTNLNNTFLLENIRNGNFKINPRTGEITRIGTPFKQPAKTSKWGFKKC